MAIFIYIYKWPTITSDKDYNFVWDCVKNTLAKSDGCKKFMIQNYIISDNFKEDW